MNDKQRNRARAVAIRRLREMWHGWSVRETCGRTGATRSAVERVERGGPLRVDDLEWLVPMITGRAAHGAAIVDAMAWLEAEGARRDSGHTMITPPIHVPEDTETLPLPLEP